MQKYNLFYWVVVPALLITLYFFSKQFTLSHHEFFGEAEARQSEINLDKDVMITQQLVTTGQHVKKGQRLLVVENSELEENIRQLDFELQEIQAEQYKDGAELQAQILALQQKKKMALAEVATQYETIKAEMTFYQNLSGHTVSSDNPNATKLLSLEKEMKKIELEFDTQIQHYKTMLSYLNKEDWGKNRVKQKQSFWQNHKKAFDVIAPYDGVIGHLNVQQGEYVKAYTSLVTFMEPYPSQVKGYVQEKYTVNLRVGDTVSISSQYHPDKLGRGVISAIGNRVIEIPEKFRKIPDLKLYGIEVFIQSIEQNSFFQKEIVKVKPRVEE